MRGVWLRLRTESRARWKAWLAMGLLLGVIGGAVLTAAAGARRTDTAYPRMLQSAGAPDLLVAPNNTGLDGYYSALSRLPEVRSLSVVLLYGIGLPASGGTVDTNVQVEGSTQFSGVYGDKVKVLQGRLFDPNDARVAMVDEQLAELDHLRPGSTLHLLGIPNDQSGNPDVSRAFPLSFRVSGIAAFDDQIVPANRANGYPRVLLTPAFFRLPAYKGLHGSDGGAVTLRAGANRSAFLSQTSSLASSPQFSSSTGGQVFVGDLDAQAAATERAIQPEAIALAIFAALAGLIALAVMSQLIGRQVLLDSSEHPVLSALGMTRRDLVVLSLLRVGIVTLFGALVAVAVAIAASPLMPIGPARVAEPSPGIEVNLAILGVGFVLAFVAPLLLVVPAAWRAASRFGPLGSAASGSEESRSSLVPAIGGGPGPLTASLGLRMALDPGRGRTAVPVRSALGWHDDRAHGLGGRLCLRRKPAAPCRHASPVRAELGPPARPRVRLGTRSVPEHRRFESGRRGLLRDGQLCAPRDTRHFRRASSRHRHRLLWWQLPHGAAGKGAIGPGGDSAGGTDTRDSSPAGRRYGPGRAQQRDPEHAHRRRSGLCRFQQGILRCHRSRKRSRSRGFGSVCARSEHRMSRGTHLLQLRPRALPGGHEPGRSRSQPRESGSRCGVSGRFLSRRGRPAAERHRELHAYPQHPDRARRAIGAVGRGDAHPRAR